ncbi:MAG: hypothetical protein KC649_03230 [Candidatus Omnitrophica bacterium]|nr:hypothetical protein [Candidatus Omnitrophota bacterium]
MGSKKKAVLYRMATDQHICPYGLKSAHLLKKNGFDVEDHKLESRKQTDDFKKEHQVETTPQTFIEGKRIGGYSDLLVYFGKNPKDKQSKKNSYAPVIAVFATTFLMAASSVLASSGQFSVSKGAELFIAYSMCVLGVLKLRDIESFSMQFITYDWLAQRKLGYSYFYPFAEVIAGIGMIGHVLTPVVAILALFIGSIGAASVFKAVYIDKRELKCACVGGNSNVPLGFISLTENVMMIVMAIWMFMNV